MRRGLVAALGLLAVLARPTAAAAHVEVSPQFISGGKTQLVDFRAPNERDQRMTGFSVTVPAGIEVVRANPVGVWKATVNGSTAAWTGGSLRSGAEGTFGVELKATTASPGAVTLRAVQRYADGEVVRWQVPLTVLPGANSPSQNLGMAAIVGALGLLLTGLVAALAWRRRMRTLQER